MLNSKLTEKLATNKNLKNAEKIKSAEKHFF